MRNRDSKLEVIWEPQISPEANERLLAAFEMIFKDVTIEVPEDLAI